jgi:SAM-dependent methyltransferase
MINRTQIINFLITQKGYYTYLEIGVDTSENFDRIIAQHKIGIDPSLETRATICVESDVFFDLWDKRFPPFDIIFIDGLHLAEQVEKDITNALEVLAPGGTIVVHDCSPNSRKAQLRTRVQSEWNGDVWKAWVKLRERSDLEMYVVDVDYGCGVIRPGGQDKPAVPGDKTWEWLEENRPAALNLISVEEFLGREACFD